MLFTQPPLPGVRMSRRCKAKDVVAVLEGPSSGNEVVLVRGLVADPHRHDDLVVAIDRRLAVVPLDPAIAALEDVAVWVGAG